MNIRRNSLLTMPVQVGLITVIALAVRLAHVHTATPDSPPTPSGERRTPND